jgi:hypothetical protein
MAAHPYAAQELRFFEVLFTEPRSIIRDSSLVRIAPGDTASVLPLTGRPV